MDKRLVDTGGFARTLTNGVAIAQAIWRHPANRSRRVRSIARFLAWQLMKRVIRRPVIISFHGRRLKCYCDSPSTSGALYFAGYPDFWEMKFLQAYLRPGDQFLDIGANTGVYSIFAASCIGSTGSIDAFEPVERTAARIEEQAKLNGLTNVRVHRFAVGDQCRVMKFGYSSTDAMMHLQRPDETGDMQHVNCITLDGFEPFGQYAAGKMDIEGAEPMALAGAAMRLKQGNPPVWLLELAGLSTCYRISSEEVVAQLSDAGFDCAVFNTQSGSLNFTTSPWRLGVQNVLAISRIHRNAIEQRLQVGTDLRR
jgi:FkbM family methyltransferase